MISDSQVVGSINLDRTNQRWFAVLVVAVTCVLLAFYVQPLMADDKLADVEKEYAKIFIKYQEAKNTGDDRTADKLISEIEELEKQMRDLGGNLDDLMNRINAGDIKDVPAELGDEGTIKLEGEEIPLEAPKKQEVWLVADLNDYHQTAVNRDKQLARSLVRVLLSVATSLRQEIEKLEEYENKGDIEAWRKYVHSIYKAFFDKYKIGATAKARERAHHLKVIINIRTKERAGRKEFIEQIKRLTPLNKSKGEDWLSLIEEMNSNSFDFQTLRSNYYDFRNKLRSCYQI